MNDRIQENTELVQENIQSEQPADGENRGVGNSVSNVDNGRGQEDLGAQSEAKEGTEVQEG